jgi:hypothetical protein
MFLDNKKYAKLFFRLLLLAVYFGFFCVQFFLRYTSSHSQQSLDLDNCHEKFASSTVSAKASCKSDTKKSSPPSYLNKRFQPQDAVMVPVCDFGIPGFYSLIGKKNWPTESHLFDRKLNALSLRGPPSFS